jgi:hypothetical protein
MFAKNILCAGGRFLRGVHQTHVHFIKAAAAFAVIAGRTGRHYVGPDVFTTHVPRDDVIDRQADIAPAAILTGIIIAPEDFSACEFDARSWPVNLTFETDDGRARDQF